MKFQDFFKKKNAHFWADFPLGILTKITLKPGESISKNGRMATDEGFIDEYYCYTHTGIGIERDYSSWSRGCEGSENFNSSASCSLDNLKTVKSRPYEDQVLYFPKWEFKII